MPIKILLLFLAVAFTEHVVEANRVHRTQGDTDDKGPVFPYEAFGIGYEDFINRIHPPLMAAMNYQPVMPHDIPQSASDGKITSVALSSNSDAVVEPNEEAAKSESFTSATLEVLPTPVAEQMLESLSSPTSELETSTGESSTKTVEITAETEEREESTEEIYVEPEMVSESNLEAETAEYQVDKPSTLSEYSVFNPDKEGQIMDLDDQNEKLPNSEEKAKVSTEEELADALRDKASAAVYEPKVSDPNESESSKLQVSHETKELPHISSEDFLTTKSDEKSSSSSDGDYYYYVPGYKYTESEVFDEASDDELATSSYEYSDSTYEYSDSTSEYSDSTFEYSDSTSEYSDSTSEYYSTDLVESEEKVIVFSETHEIQDSRQSHTKEIESEKPTQSDSSRERESSPSESNFRSESLSDATEKIKSSTSKDSEHDMSDDAKGSSKPSKMSEEWESETYSARVDNDNNDEQKSSNDENSELIVNEDSKVEYDSDSKQTLSIGSEAVSSEVSKPTQVSSEPVSSDSESQMPSSSPSKGERGESDSGKTTLSESGEAAASTSFPMSSKSSVQSGELVNIPQIMEELMVLKEAAKVSGQKLDFESMRKIIEQAITELSSLRKRLTRKEYVLDDLNQVIDELQKLCQAICINLPEKYFIPKSDSKSSSSKSKRH